MRLFQSRADLPAYKIGGMYFNFLTDRHELEIKNEMVSRR